METKKIIDHWIRSSDLDFETMMTLYQAGHYTWALFIGHLVIEKLLKCCYIKIHKSHPPLIHNLLRLAQQAEISLDEEKEAFFAEVTEFNILARYEDFKMEFYKRCTKNYAGKWIEEIKTNRQWIKKALLNL